MVALLHLEWCKGRDRGKSVPHYVVSASEKQTSDVRRPCSASLRRTDAAVRLRSKIRGGICRSEKAWHLLQVQPSYGELYCTLHSDPTGSSRRYLWYPVLRSQAWWCTA